MIFTQAFNYEDILAGLDKETDCIALIGCETCVRVAGSGGQEKLKQLAMQLRTDGYQVKDGFMVPTACTPKLANIHLAREINTILSLACSAGTSNLRRWFPGCKVIETIQDVGLMIENARTKTLQITLPYEAFKEQEGKAFAAFTGKAVEEVQQ